MCVNETVFNDARTRNKRVSMLLCKLIDNQAAHSLDQDANFKQFETSSWMFDNPACRPTPEDLVSLVLERHTGRQVSDERLVARSLFCDQLFHHREQLRRLLAYATAFSPMAIVNSDALAFDSSKRKSTARSIRLFQSCWSTRYERGSLLSILFSLVLCFVLWRGIFHLQWNCISARTAGHIAQRLKIDLVLLRCVSLSLKSLRVHFLGRIPCPRNRHLVLSAFWLD